MSPRRWVVAGGIALVGVAATATAMAGGLGGPANRRPDGTTPPTASSSATPLPSASASLEPPGEPTAAATAEPTAEPTPTREPTPRPSAAPTPVTYVVQEGDTLNGIAAQFETTAEAIRQANGLPGDVINIGQVLVIP